MDGVEAGFLTMCDWHQWKKIDSNGPRKNVVDDSSSKFFCNISKDSMAEEKSKSTEAPGNCFVSS